MSARSDSLSPFSQSLPAVTPPTTTRNTAMASASAPPHTPGKISPPNCSKTPCLRASQLLPGHFYLAQIMFPYTITNEHSPLKGHLHGLTPGQTPRFRLDNPHRELNLQGLYYVDRKVSKNYTRPALVVNVDGDIANILICSTNPNQVNIKHLVPFQGTTHYPGMPNAVVTNDRPSWKNERFRRRERLHVRRFQDTAPGRK